MRATNEVIPAADSNQSSTTQPTGSGRTVKLLVLGLVLVGIAGGVRLSPWAREYQYRRASLGALQSWGQRSPNDALLSFYLGTAYHNSGILPEALQSFQRATTLDPKMARAFVGMAAVRMKLGQMPEALEAAAAAAKLDPRSPDAQLMLGILSYGESKSRARLEFQKLTKLSPKNPEGWHWLGKCARELNDIAGALAPMQEAVRLAPNQGSYHRDLAAVYMDLGRFEPARAELELALKLIPQDAETNYLLARNLSNTAAGSQDLERAQQLMGQAVELLPEDDTRNLGAVMVERAEVLRQLKRYEEAYALLQQARKVDSGNTRTLHYMGLVARALGKNAEADRWLSEYSRTSRESKELSNMEQRVKQDTKNPELRLRLARLYARAGNFPFAVNQYEMCLFLQPGNVAAKKERQALIDKAPKTPDAGTHGPS